MAEPGGHDLAGPRKENFPSVKSDQLFWRILPQSQPWSRGSRGAPMEQETVADTV